MRNWSGLKTSGSKQQIYYQVKNSWDPNSDLTENDFYFQLRNSKEDCLLLSETNRGKIKFRGSLPTEDEDLTPTLESDVVLDWMDAIGGAKLVNQTFRVFSKELETESLADLRQRISDNLPSLISEAEQVDINRTFVPSRPNPELLNHHANVDLLLLPTDVILSLVLLACRKVTPPGSREVSLALPLGLE